MKRPEVGKTIAAAGVATNYHERGGGRPVVLLHGSGPGVSAWANWGRILPKLSADFHVFAPDIVGFGFTERPPEAQYGIKLWVQQLVGFIDALGLDKPIIVGNSFGGGLALAASLRAPGRFGGLVLMGTPAGTFEQTKGLASAWAYEPSIPAMREMLRLFPYDTSIITDAMVQDRYEASLLHGGQAAFRKLMAPPAPPGEKTLVKGVGEEGLRTIETPALILHGREDCVVPADRGQMLHQNLSNSELHSFGKCGHWVMIEREPDFLRLVSQFASTH